MRERERGKIDCTHCAHALTEPCINILYWYAHTLYDPTILDYCIHGHPTYHAPQNFFSPLQIIEAVTNNGIKQPCPGAAFPFTSLPSCLVLANQESLIYLDLIGSRHTSCFSPSFSAFWPQRISQIDTNRALHGTANHLSKSDTNCFLPLKCSTVF